MENDLDRIGFRYDSSWLKRIDTNLAFTIGNQKDPGHINKDNWKIFAQECDISHRYLVQLIKLLIEQILDSIPVVLQKFSDEYGKYEALQRVKQIINQQCKRTLSDLN